MARTRQETKDAESGLHQLTTMNTTNLRILQLNIMKSRAGMEALINNSATQDLDILLIQEPPISAYRTHVNHRLWYRYQPTYPDGNARIRSLIYVNKRISTSAHRQIPCNHPDVTAIRIWNEERQMPTSGARPTRRSSDRDLADNQRAIKLASNPEYHRRTKHIRIQYHYTRECVASGEIKFVYVPTKDMAADGLTKALPEAKFTRFIGLMGLK